MSEQEAMEWFKEAVQEKTYGLRTQAALEIGLEALQECNERRRGCEWCCDEAMFDKEDMELELQHPLENEPRMVYPNFCPMCGRKLEHWEDGEEATS